MDNEGYSRLCNAIIVQAVKDYMSAKRQDNERKMAELRNFFRSGWFNALTEINGEIMLEMIEEKYAEIMASGGSFKYFDFRNA